MTWRWTSYARHVIYERAGRLSGPRVLRLCVTEGQATLVMVGERVAPPSDSICQKERSVKLSAQPLLTVMDAAPRPGLA
jgi:hypothetical protein